jgi:pimeloyl-ACP methyl ester carboxylesterase
MIRNMDRIEIAGGSGQIAVEAVGSGPFVLCVPGVGESRASFRHLLPGLAAAGYRVAAMDLRGHGDSSAEFDCYDDDAAASDVLAVVEALGGAPATVMGNSMGAAAGVLAAAQRPEALARLVLIGPFVRDHSPAVMRLVMRMLLARPWGPLVWRCYYGSLFGQQRPEDHDEHVRHARALLTRPGRWPAFAKTARTSHASAEAALARVTVPTLVVMGSCDRDFRDPRAEAEWVAQALHGRYQMIAGAGHYPQGEVPEAVLAAVLPFLEGKTAHG